MVELEYQNERYMVDGGKWYRRLKVGEVRVVGYQYNESGEWVDGLGTRIGYPTYDRDTQYRVPCSDPRPPFKVGDRVRVARKDEGWKYWMSAMGDLIGKEWKIEHVDCDGDLVVGDVRESWTFPPWCLDLIEPEPSTKQESTMKVKQWQLREAKEPKTLADVESSRERPVLCWAVHDAALLLMFEEAGELWIRTRTGGVVRAERDKHQYKLYHQPAVPTKLEDVPDRRVIYARVTDSGDETTQSGSSFWFRYIGTWWIADDGDIFSQTSELEPSCNNWQLTDHCVELVETEVKVL